jgi:hypothetical protein
VKKLTVQVNVKLPVHKAGLAGALPVKDKISKGGNLIICFIPRSINLLSEPPFHVFQRSSSNLLCLIHACHKGKEY